MPITVKAHTIEVVSNTTITIEINGEREVNDIISDIEVMTKDYQVIIPINGHIRDLLVKIRNSLLKK